MLELKEDQENSEEESQADQNTSEENGNVSDEEQFTNVTFEDINREELPEEVRGAYDDLSDRFARMQAAYTQKTQAISASEDDAGNWRSIANNPELSNYMLDAINRVANNESLAQPALQEKEELPNAEEHPEEYLAALIGGIVNKSLDDRLPGLSKEISQVSGHIRNQQAASEFENLCNKYPSAKVIGQPRLNAVRAKYGNTLSMEQALAIESIGQPDVLFSADRKRTPSGNKTQTRVEQSTSGKTGNDTRDVPKDVLSLHKAAKALQKEGGESFINSARRSAAKFLQRGETT